MHASRAAKKGSRGNAPCGVQRRRLWWGLGQRPNCSASDQSKRKSQQGAGSEASLPVTSRFLRSAPKLLFPTPMLCRARWARPDCLTSDHSWSFPQAGVSPLRRRQKGNGNGRSPRSPFGNPRCTLLLVSLFTARVCAIDAKKHESLNLNCQIKEGIICSIGKHRKTG